MFLMLIKNELIKISGKWRSFIGFIAIAVLMPLILWGFKVGGGQIHREMTHQLEGVFTTVGTLFNGFLATYIVMNFLWVHIPFLVMLVAGDVVAGEGAAGTFRIYLTRPISRWKILLSKLFATYIYTAILILFFAGCVTAPQRIPEIMIIMDLDFTKYSQKGFLFTPDKYILPR